MRSYYWLICLLGLILTSCNTRPDYVIDEETMTDLLVDIHMSEGLLEVQGVQMNDTKNYGQEIMAAVFLEHGVTRAQYDTSLVWYSQNLKKLIRIYNHVDQELLRREEEYRLLANEQRSAGLHVSGDNMDVWGLNRAYLLDESRKLGARRWNITPDSCYKNGDTLEWHLHTYDMPKGQGLVASMALLVDNKIYASKELAAGVATSCVGNDSTLVLRAAVGKDDFIKRITLSLNLLHTKHDGKEEFAPALVDSIQLIRIHRK